MYRNTVSLYKNFQARGGVPAARGPNAAHVNV